MSGMGSLFRQAISAQDVFHYSSNKGKKRRGKRIAISSQKAYKDSLHYACEYFKTLGIRDIQEIGVEEIQKYEIYLEYRQLTASTIHLYLAPVCKLAKVPMDKINKPIRHASEFTKGSNSEVTCGGEPAELNMHIGLRAWKELAALRGDDLFYDEGTDTYYINVKRGKNGKPQYQKVIPEFVEYVKAFFDGTHKKLFKKSDFVVGYNYHNDRRNLAIELYSYYEEKIAEEPGYAKQLYNQIAFVWHRLNKKHRNDLEPLSYFLEHPYRLRGKNKELAIAQGKPVVLNRLILRAISVLHLSHWRDGVTVQSYFFARRNQEDKAVFWHAEKKAIVSVYIVFPAAQSSAG